MARIATGSIVADISGKVGDNIYSRNRQGPYVKQYVAPTQPGSAFQITAQAAMATAVTKWNALSDAEFTAYVAFTKSFWKTSFCGSRRPDPRTFYIGNHINQIFAGDGGITPRTILPSSGRIDSFDIDVNDGTKLNYIFQGQANGPQDKVIYYGTPVTVNSVRSLNSVPMVSFYSNLQFFNLSVDISAFWIARFGGTFQQPGQRTFVKARIIDRLSGICYGEVWNSNVFVGTGTPFTFGEQSVLSGTSNGQKRRAFEFTPGQNGTIVSITFYHTASTDDVKVGVYSDNAAEPDSLLSISATTPIDASEGWQTVNLPSPLAIVSGTTYWIAIVKDGLSILKTGASSFPIHFHNTAEFLLPNPFGVPTTSANSTSFYCSGIFT